MSGDGTQTLISDFKQFVTSVRDDACVSFLIEQLDETREVVLRAIEHSVHEALQTLRIISKFEFLNTNRRLLEVGAGLGLVGAFLSSRGVDIVSIEPEDMYFLPLTRFFKLDCEKRLVLPIEQLDAESNGRFDFIFSNNVLEHVDNPDTCLLRLAELLHTGAFMCHNCPNYLVPYEPHYGIPLVPFAPWLTEIILPKRIHQQALWRSLNFITYQDVQRIAARADCSVEFWPEQLHAAFGRLEHDQEFRSRHRLLTKLYAALEVSGFINLMKKLPGRFATPMVFELRKR